MKYILLSVLLMILAWFLIKSVDVSVKEDK